MRLVALSGPVDVGPPLDEAQVAERLREELFAAVVLSRAVLIRRVLARGGTEERLALEALRRLVSVGDVVEGERGLVASAPVRLVDRGGGRGFWLGTTPARWLARQAPMLLLNPGWPRGVMVTVEIRALVVELGGVVVDVDRWTGVDRILPPADWLADLERRLQDREVHRSLSVPQGVAVQHRLPGTRWRSGPPPMAGRALLRWGGRPFYRFALVQDGELLDLSPDEATRTALAMDHNAGCPSTFLVQAGADGRVILTIDAWLPAAEWRLLAAGATSLTKAGRPLIVTLDGDIAKQSRRALRRAGLLEIEQVVDGETS